jgi:hypothetical protein
VLVRCPSCRETFSTDHTGIQDCPLCGKPLAVPEPASVVSPSGTGTGEAAAASAGANPGTPWERRPEIGTWAAWRETVVAALFEPAKLFGAARLDQGARQAAFAVITVSVFSIIGQLLNRFLLGPWRQRALESLRAQGISNPLLEKLFEASTGHSPRTVILAVLLTPPIVFMVLYLNAAVTHAFATVLGQNKRGFPATFAACAYGCAPLVFAALPGCGESIAVIWAVVLMGIGLKHTHGIKSGGAVATVLAPYVLLCCGGCALAALVGAGRGVLGQ